jgi:hypothetical protein
MPSCCGLFFVGFRKRLSGSTLHRLCPLWKSAGAMRCEAVDMSHSRRDNIYTIKYCTRKPKSKKNWESSTIGRERIGQRALICFAMHAMRPWARVGVGVIRLHCMHGGVSHTHGLRPAPCAWFKPSLLHHFGRLHQGLPITPLTYSPFAALWMEREEKDKHLWGMCNHAALHKDRGGSTSS